MRATKSLPEHYRKIGTLDVSKSQRLLLLLNMIGVLALVGAGWLFFRAMFWIRERDMGRAFQVVELRNAGSFFGLVVVIFLLFVLHIVVHEAIHGVFFWWFTRTRPQFAFRWAYAYAAAPAWYIPRNLFLITTLAPLVLMSLGGLVLFFIAPPAWLLGTWFVITMNAGGAVGDLVVAGWLLRQPATCLAQDRGDAVTLFVPE